MRILHDDDPEGVGRTGGVDVRDVRRKAEEVTCREDNRLPNGSGFDNTIRDQQVLDDPRCVRVRLPTLPGGEADRQDLCRSRRRQPIDEARLDGTRDANGAFRALDVHARLRRLFDEGSERDPKRVCNREQRVDGRIGSMTSLEPHECRAADAAGCREPFEARAAGEPEATDVSRDCFQWSLWATHL